MLGSTKSKTKTMGPLDWHQVEEWLEGNKEVVQDYFIKRADLTLINKWLVAHGFHTVHEYITGGRRGSMSQDSSGPGSPSIPMTDSGFFSDKDSKHQRSNSKKHLRHDYARSKMRSMFRTCEPAVTSSTALDVRRSSLKGMRQFKSLPATSVNMLSYLIESKIRLPRYASKDEDLKRELRYTNEREFFLEIVKDISNDLDLTSLTSKIVVNTLILCDAECGSVYIIEGPKNNQYLVSKGGSNGKGYSGQQGGNGGMFTVDEENVVKLPLGRGIIGWVAETGHTYNRERTVEDPRYNPDVDRIAGCRIGSMLCMPIHNADGEIIGVAQVVNKRQNGCHFTGDDEKLFETYLTFCGIAIKNAQLFDGHSKEYERNKALLEVVHDLFEEQTSVDTVVTKIMQRSQTLLKCEKCSVLLRDLNEESIVFDKVFDLNNPLSNGHSYSSSADFGQQGSEDRGGGTINNKIAELVASTGETVNITESKEDVLGELDALHTSQNKSLMCKPIRNPDLQIIGVAQIVNKQDGLPFDELDDQLFEAFTIFCGLGINNCMLYDRVRGSLARQAVALECLAYHAGVSFEEGEKLKDQVVPEADALSLDKLTFNDFSLRMDDMVLAGIRIFMDTGLINKFKIDYETLCRFLLTVKKNYRNVAYHNWRHAFNVCQVMYALFQTMRVDKYLDDKEALALIVGCLCHDLDHRGTNNAFQQKSSSALAQLYGTKATLEHHHFNHAVIILNSDGSNIFENLTPNEYEQVMKLLKHSILATDLSLHFQNRDKFAKLADESDVCWQEKSNKEILRGILMTACDIATISKPWDVQSKAAELVMTEFFDQGDKERLELKIQPTAQMDREKQHELPKLQLGWIDGICLPLYKNLVKFDANFQPMLEGVLQNRRNWEQLEQIRLQGNRVKETGV
ncbi:dual 3',5'-cyclic-AMP and -GMP phosphodiesterase 11A-like isoform X1 [Tubulanus polymorphus]|uniref:dual 3',5'-cyclic-AMP and -GMP phosphodiesterase 11A-like isoform X1 n=1 Tax=Tubulanus polymorphus TaxID=672921 RepID=UPI003DA62882